jgi:uncharacterized protein (TIGR02145 family)
MKSLFNRLIVLFLTGTGLLIIFTCKELEKSMLVSTGDVSSVTTNSADVSGNIIDLGGGATQHGHCYGKQPNLTTSNSKTELGVPKGSGGFTSQLKNLEAGTLYYVIAYISDGTTTAYGKEKSFTTEAASLPSVTTNAVSSITTTTATSGGEVTTDGGSPVTSRGVCWNTSTGPSISNSKTTDGSGSGSFSSSLTGLIAGTKYYIRAYATNVAGTTYGNELNLTTNAVTITVPGAPAIGTATAGNAQATVTFTPPASNGGSAITGYTVTSNPGSITGTGTASPITVTGLSNGTAYTFTVTATNAVGTGPSSAGSNSVTPSTVPGAPTIGTATAGNAQATVTFTAPSSNGGSAITGYTVTSNPGSITGTGTASPITVTGLTNGTAYTFTVTATNAVGTGPASAASNSVTPAAAATVPGAPTIGTATAGNAQATVTFTPPASNGGSAITGYTVTSNPGNITALGAGSPITVTGLTNGTAYTFTVTATNAIGTGPASAASNSVTPAAAATVPGAPTIGTATAGNAQATVTFTPPASNGGSAITGYTVTSNPGNITAPGAGSSITVTGLTNGTAYTFTVTATNAIGTGPASAASNSVTPAAAATVPGAPIIGTATAGDGQATVTFTPPASNGGSAITGYTVTSSPGNITASGIGSPITVTGLTNGTSYTFTVTATNAIGTSPASAASNSVMPCKAPSVTTNTASDIGSTIATLSGTVNANGFSTTVTFEWGLTTSYGSIATASQSPVSGSTNTAVSAGLTGLVPNTTYHYRVKAVSCQGTPVYGGDQYFTTSCISPNATTNAASGTGSATATLNGSVNANGFSTTVTFEYGLTTSYGSTINAAQNPVSGSSNIAVSAGLTGLTSNTLYHYRVKAVNCYPGPVYGGDMSFTTLCTLPSAVTSAATSVGSTSAVMNGAVNANGSPCTTSVTFEYGTTDLYGTSIAATPSSVTGTSAINVSASLTGLTPGTTYYFRIKAVNNGGTSYSTGRTFSTPCPAPTATTNDPSNVGSTSATFNGSVNANGCNTNVTFEYGLTTSYGSTYTVPNPVTGFASTNVSGNVIGLLPGSTYHYRIKASNPGGTNYGLDKQFKTTVTDIDNNVYNWVTISGSYGTQVWMTENLKTTRLRTGDVIPEVTNTAQWFALTSLAFCWYNNNPAYKDPYGALYNWYAVNSGNLCPAGWSVPTDAEWRILLNNLGGESVAGGKLKETGLEHWSSPNTGATNESGFTAVPAGEIRDLGMIKGFLGLGLFDLWWARDLSGSSGIMWGVNYSSSDFFPQTTALTNGFSVRCIKN